MAAATLALPAAASAEVRQVTNPQGAVVHETSPRGFPSGAYIGHLDYGDNFDYDHANADKVWCWGHAYGNVHKDGWVKCSDIPKGG